MGFKAWTTSFDLCRYTVNNYHGVFLFTVSESENKISDDEEQMFTYRPRNGELSNLET